MRRVFPGVFIIIVVILILSSYSNTFYSPPIIDDYHSFIDEPSVYVKEWSVDSLILLSETFFGWARWIPMISFSLDHWIGSGNIVSFHLTNLLIHIFCLFAVVFLVFNLIQITKKKTPSSPVPDVLFAIFVAGLWALHPVQTNAVTYLVQRMASIQAFFYIMSVSFYIFGRRKQIESHSVPKALPSYLACLIAGIGASLSKENAAMLPVMLLVTEIWFFNPNLHRSSWNRLRESRKITRILSFVVFLLVALCVAIKVQHFAAGYANRHFTMLERLFTESRIVIWYISLLIWPALSRMSIEHDVVISTSLLDPPATLLSVVSLCFWGWLIVRYRKRFPLASYGGAWFLLNLLIESSFVPLELIFEHRLYLPSVGLALFLVCVVMCALGYLLANRTSRDVVILSSCSFALLFSGLALMTFYRNQSWENKIAIYEDAALKAPNNPRAHANLAGAYGAEGFYERSIDEAELTLRLGQQSYEQYIVAANAIVGSLLQLGRIEEAIARGNQLVKATPDEANATALPFLYLNLARAYWKCGQLEKAYAEAMRALVSLRQAGRGSLQLRDVEGMLVVILKESANLQADLDQDGAPDPGEFPIKTWIAKAFLRHGERGEAKKLLMLASVENPKDVETVRLLEQIKKEDALNSTQAAKENMKEKYVSSPFSRFNTSMAVAILLRRENLPAPLRGLGEKFVDYALEIQPAAPDAHLLKAWYLRDRNEIGEAVASAQRAIAADPDYAKAWAGLGFFLLESNRLQEAVSAFDKTLELYPGCPQRKTIREIISGIRENMPLARGQEHKQ
jgi:protein O-mannosyl-transferase